MTSYNGGYLWQTALDKQEGWRLFYPDTGMATSDATYAGVTLQAKSSAAYSLVGSANPAQEYKFIPSSVPDGNYGAEVPDATADTASANLRSGDRTYTEWYDTAG